MDAKTVMKVIEALIGKIEPVGESNTDESRLENIMVWGEVAQGMVGKLYEVGFNYKPQRYMCSVNSICARADKKMEEIKEFAEDYFRE